MKGQNRTGAVIPMLHEILLEGRIEGCIFDICAILSGELSTDDDVLQLCCFIGDSSLRQCTWAESSDIFPESRATFKRLANCADDSIVAVS